MRTIDRLHFGAIIVLDLRQTFWSRADRRRMLRAGPWMLGYSTESDEVPFVYQIGKELIIKCLRDSSGSSKN